MGILDRALNVGEGKQFRRYEQRVAEINAFEPELELDSDEELRARLDGLRERARGGESLDDLLPECFAIVRETGRRRMAMRHFDVQLIGGMVLHGGSIAEMRTGEGKTLTATLAVVLNTLAGAGVHVVTVNDYLARRDAEWMTPIYEALGVTVGRAPVPAAAAARRSAPTPATSPTAPTPSSGSTTCATTWRAASRRRSRTAAAATRRQAAHRAHLRDRRRGRQHPDRRGAYAADHQRRSGAGGRPLRQVRPARADDGSRQDAGGSRSAHQEGVRRRLRLRVRREVQDRRGDRARRRQGGALPRHRPPLPGRERHARQPPAPGAEGRVALQARRRLPGRRRRGEDHRRVHRPHARGAPLVRGPAPGDRGQGGRPRAGGEPDARDDHAAELLPPLRQALRHDRHGADRGDRVHEDLQAAGRADPDQPADGPRGPQRSGLQDQGGQVVGRRARDRRAPRRRPAGARRHDLGRGLRAALRPPAPPRHPARGAQREARVRGARGRDDRRGRPPGRGHDRDQHGRPRRRHQARRQRRASGAAGAAPSSVCVPATRATTSTSPSCCRRSRRGSRRTASASSKPAASTSSAPSATSRAASTTSCAGAPDARATPARAASSCPPRTT